MTIDKAREVRVIFWYDAARSWDQDVVTDLVQELRDFLNDRIGEYREIGTTITVEFE